MTTETPTPSSAPSSRRVRWGLGFMWLAAIGWTVCLVVPLTPLPHRMTVAVTALIIAETSFLVGLALLGRSYYHQLKKRLRDRVREPKR